MIGLQKAPLSTQVPDSPPHPISGDCWPKFSTDRNQGARQFGPTYPYVKKPAAINTTGLE